MTIVLTEEQKQTYQEQGYLLVPDLLNAEELEALRERLRAYTHGGKPLGGLRVQIEPRIQRGEMQVEQWGDGIRKIELLVENDDLFRELGLHANLVGILTEILGHDLKMFRNALLLKPPAIGSAKGWHQDSPYWSIEPMELCSCWLPFDDATLENGCMVVVPRGHKRGSLPHVSVTDDFVIPPESLAESEGVAVPMKAGSGLFFHSLLPHYTAPNRSTAWRRAIALSYMSSHSRYTGEGDSPVFFPVQGATFAGCVR